MKVLIAGDYCPQNRVADLFEKRDFESVLGNVRDVISTVDYSIVNFECPVCDGSETPIVKYGPNLKCTEHGVEALKWAGFKCVTLANNHFLDYGEEGVAKTLKTCQDYDIDTVGGGVTLNEASQVLYRKIEGKILAIINCCEHEFSIATDATAGSNPLNPFQQYYAIQDARKKADYILVIVHGGHEHFQLPSPRMQETYRFFVDSGADAVVNHHQHCYSGYEIYNGRPIFYGLGNFCFENIANASKSWHEGYMVELTYGESNPHFMLIPFVQCKDSPMVSLKKESYYNEQIALLNDIINDKECLTNELKAYYNMNKQSIADIFEPFTNRYARWAQRRGLLPYFLSTQHKIMLQNYILCESHRDKLKYFFEE